MTQSTPTLEQVTQDTIAEHQQILFYIDQIEQTLESIRSGLSDVEPLRRLAAQLEGLKERLREHYRAEEEYLFQAILEIFPAKRVEIDRLTNQHAKSIEILELAQLHSQAGELSDADALRVDLAGFLASFREHEQEEDELMQLVAESSREA